MKAYFQTDPSGNFYNVNTWIAQDGFTQLGWETARFHTLDEIPDRDPETLVAGGIGMVRGRLAQLGIPHPGHEVDYPEELRPWLGRKVWASTVEEIFNNPNSWNIFIKPQTETKKFAGKMVREFRDFIGLVDPAQPTPIWCSEEIRFVTEWRCFIRYGEILDIRQYKGAWDSRLDLGWVREVVAAFHSAPAAYALDAGVDLNGSMKLVEINDGHSLGTYGIGSVPYARLLSARWAELTGTCDYANF